MQLPPLSSSSYTVIPEKSFHLCHTYTLSNMHTQQCTHTQNRHTINTHTQTQTRFFFPHSTLHFQLAAPVSTLWQHNTSQHCLTGSKSALQLSLQCKAYLFLHKSPSHPFTVSSLSPRFLQFSISQSKPPLCRGLSRLILDCKFCYPAVVRGYNSW